MGKHGSVNLIIPKNNFNKEDFELVLSILKKHGGEYETSKLEDDISEYYSTKKHKKLDRTSIIHRLVAPRYLGFTYQDNDYCYLSEFGDYYINSTASTDKIDCIFLAMSSITFGKNNPGTTSNSIVEAPNVFLKMLVDLGTATLNEFMIVLYLMEVRKLSYYDAINKIKGSLSLTSLTDKAEKAGCRKFRDAKINIFFEEVGIVKKDGNEYQLSDYVRSTYYYYLKDLSAVNEEREEKEIPIIDDGEPTVDDILSELAKIERKYDGSFIDSPLPHTGGLHIKRVAKRIGFKSKSKLLSENQNNILGWLGEQYIDNLLHNLKSGIRSHIKLEKSETISNIEWFNKGCTFSADWRDQSIGHGCDIELTTSKKRKILVEVKSSLSNTPFFSTTGNELLTMSESKENYYLVKVNNVRALYKNEKPSIAIINNPIRLLESIYNIKDISFYLYF